MFYGLNKFIKKLLPKQLFYRGLLIVATPIIILQITILIVFFDSLWIKTNKGMTRSLVSEIVTIIDIYNNESQYNKQIVTDLYNQNFNFSVRFLENEKLPDIKVERWFSPMDRTLRRELKPKFNAYWFNTIAHEEVVDLRIKFRDGVLQIFFPKERIQASSIRIFSLWITLPAFLLILVAMIFLKNQTRPIIKLAEASEKFGRGEDIEEFRPSGALEIRIRTPLTRIKLQLALIKDMEISRKLSGDVDEMEKMLNEYLQFSKSTFSDKTETFNISELIKSAVKKYENANISLDLPEKTIFSGRINLIQRCLNNLIDNSLKYATKVKVKLEKIKKNIVIIIEDNGPGIPASEYENVFKPFYKIDKGRSKTKSSVGLGLSISSDIIRSHGGTIELRKSEMGGLEVMISLPV